MSKKETQIHRLIYGFALETDEDCKCEGIFKRFTLPMYGSLSFIGFQYDIVKNLYTKNRFVYDGEFRISGAKVPESVVKLFEKVYPEREAKCYALIDGVYTSHYTYAKILFGYYVKENENEENNDDDEVDGYHLVCSSYGHNMKTKSNLFIGTILAELPALELSEDCEKLATIFHNIYKPPTDFHNREEMQTKLNNLKLKIKTQLPVLTLIQYNCFCCT